MLNQTSMVGLMPSKVLARPIENPYKPTGLRVGLGLLIKGRQMPFDPPDVLGGLLDDADKDGGALLAPLLDRPELLRLGYPL